MRWWEFVVGFVVTCAIGLALGVGIVALIAATPALRFHLGL